MRNKDYRELQISSSLLVFIFLTIIILGIIIFLLGVSVGKKQVSLTEKTNFTSGNNIEKVIADKPVQLKEEKVPDPINEEIASHKEIKEKKKPPTPAPTTKTPEIDLYYVQVGAYQSKQGAEDHAKELNNFGFATRIFDPSPSDRRKLYRVRVGGFKTRKEAEQVLNNVADKEKKSASDYFITKQ